MLVITFVWKPAFGRDVGVRCPYLLCFGTQYNSFKLMFKVTEPEGMSVFLVQASHFVEGRLM